MYLLYKLGHTDGILDRLQEKPDRCADIEEGVLAFKDAARHLVGRKPSAVQVAKILETGFVRMKSRAKSYRFYLGKYPAEG